MQTTTLSRRIIRIALAACLTLASGSALAQAWPTKPVTILSPFPAGGITDFLARTVGEELSKSFGQPVVVENRLGAGGAIAMATLAKAAPDGYTLVMTSSSTIALIPALNPNATFHPKDFEPIGYVAALPIMLVVHPSLPAANLKEFIAYARANPNKLNCAHHGNGTGTHLACVQFDRLTGSQMVYVSYKGAPQVNLDLLAGRVQVYFGTLPTQIQYVHGGQMRTYGVASNERVSSAPDIPTLGEQGLSGLTLDVWNALFAPAGTPKVVISRLSAELARILNLPEVRRKIEATGSIVRITTPEQLRKLTIDAYDSARKLGVEANIKLD